MNVIDEQRLVADARRELTRRMHSTITLVENETYERFTRKIGTPSSPGEYPAKQTGELVNSLHTSVSMDADGMDIDFELTAEHVNYLGDRKLLPDVMEEIQPQLDRIWS